MRRCHVGSGLRPASRAFCPARRGYSMATFLYRAIAADGKVRTGSLTAENDKLVARELRTSGTHPRLRRHRSRRRTSSSTSPRFGGGKRRDVLFFTQELSTLLNSGVPLDRGLSITAELTERAASAPSSPISCASSKAANRSPTAWPPIPTTSPSCTSTWSAQVKPPAAWPSSSNACPNSRSSRDELRNYIVSSMIYPALLACVGWAPSWS